MKEKVACLHFTPDGNKILSLIALFEKSFSIDWIVDLTQARPSNILSQLDEWVRQGLLTKEGSGEFFFKNQNVKKALKDEMPLEEKVRFNRDIAQLYMKELPDGERKNQMVTYHLLQTVNDIDGCSWLLKTGDSYLRQFSYEDALQCYSKILDDLCGIAGEEADILFITAAIKYSKISTARHDTTKTRSIIKEAMKRADKLNKKEIQAILQMHMAKNEWLRSRFKTAMRYFKDGWSIAKKAQDPQIARAASTFTTFFLYWQGRFQEAVEYYEKGVPDVEKYPKGRFPLFAAVTVAYCYARTGHVTQGLGMMDNMYMHCVEKGDIFLAGHISLAIGNTMVDIRRLETAVQYLERALEEAKQSNNRWVLINANLILAFANYLRGKNDLSMSHLRQFLHHSKQVKVTVRPHPHLMELCWAMEQGILPYMTGLSFEKEINEAIKGHNIYLKGVAYRLKGLQQRKKGICHGKVIRSLKRSIRWLRVSGHLIEQARSMVELSQQYLLAGDEKKAEETTYLAKDILKEFSEDLIPGDLLPLITHSSSTKDHIKKHLRLCGEIQLIHDDNQLLVRVISTMNRIVGAEIGGIFVLEEDASSPRLKLKASKNLTPEQVGHPSFANAMKMMEEAAATGKNVIDGSLMCVPLVLRGRVIGVLYFQNRLLRRAFDKIDYDILKYYATLAALSVENMQLYEEQQRLTQTFEEEKRYLEEEHIRNLHFEEIVGQSPAIMNVLAKIEHVAPLDTTVLIFGETGVGKELVARAIQRYSPRHKKPFIQVHCSTLPEDLFPTELFGHEKGAFTGASCRHIGRLELADGGTLFLDEIGTLSLNMQVRLLRVLQTRTFERVGGNKTIHSDFRLIAATNDDLVELVKAGRFRPDLYYRLNVYPIYVPPLRERKEDIPLLAYYFLKIFMTKAGKTFKGIRETDMERLIRYDWPGNVRELQNIIERSVILSSGPYLEVQELGSTSLNSPDIQGGVTLVENERRHILWALERSGWKIRGTGGAAELLDIHPSTLRFRMKKLGIQRPKDLPRRNNGLSPLRYRENTQVVLLPGQPRS